MRFIHGDLATAKDLQHTKRCMHHTESPCRIGLSDIRRLARELSGLQRPVDDNGTILVPCKLRGPFHSVFQVQGGGGTADALTTGYVRLRR